MWDIHKNLKLLSKKPYVEALADYSLYTNPYLLEVHGECLSLEYCYGNVFAQVMIAKYFKVKADPSTDVVPRTLVGCTIIDTGEPILAPAIWGKGACA